MYRFIACLRVRAFTSIAFAFIASLSLTSNAALADGGGDWLTKSFSSASSDGLSRLGGPDSRSRKSRGSKGVQVASLGGGFAPSPGLGTSLSGGGGGIKWAASSSCLSGALAGTISAVAAQFGSVTVSSTCRSQASNSRAGGAKKSYHLTGSAADFRVHGNVSAAYAYLRSVHSGGLKHYGGGLFHIDTGPRRPF